MDTSTIDIRFDNKGICNYCSDFKIKFKNFNNHDKNLKIKKLNDFIKKVKLDGKNQKYDCIIGISGGVDSSWALVKAIEHGLRPLAVHMDNGWNSELAQNNIYNLVNKLSIDLHTHVIEWEEYRELMIAFFKANVVDIELLYDNAMYAVNYKLCSKFNVKYILSGMNLSTEGMAMPKNWAWLKFDYKNIKSIAKINSSAKIKSFTGIGTLGLFWYRIIRSCKWINFLDFFEYDKFHALDVLTKNYGFKPYPYKHYESFFTRFYQGYLLPKKFKIDKRRLHFSTLIISEYMTRDQALEDLMKSSYGSETDLENDIQYFLKKMKWEKKDLDDYLSYPPSEHDKFGSEKKLFYFFKSIYDKFFK